MTIFDFNENSDLNQWRVVNDVVMGGRSNSSFEISADGHAVFQGRVSLENNGGFSSVRHRFQQQEISGFKKVILKIKGDGKKYQFRIKSDRWDRHSYIGHFQTTRDWQTIEINLEDMYPAFRGRKLSMPNYPAEHIGEIAFLIGNKTAEHFRLEIDAIRLE